MMSGAARFFTVTGTEHPSFAAVDEVVDALVALDVVEVTVLGPVDEDPERKELLCLRTAGM
jgi:hypothetical protein